MSRARSAGARSVARQMTTVAIVATFVVLVAAYALNRGVGLGVALAMAAVPAALAVGHRHAMKIFAVIVVVRPLVDGYGLSQVTLALGLSVVAVAFVVAMHDARAMLALGMVTLPVLAATAQAYGTYGVTAVNETMKVISGLSAAVVVLFAPGAWTRARAARLVQIAIAVPALVAIFQTVSGTARVIGVNSVARSTGTISQADPASFIFAIGAFASIILVVEGSRRRLLDLVAILYFTVAAVTTGTVNGLIALVLFLVFYVAMVYRVRSRQLGWVLAGLLAVAAIAVLTPIGQARIAEFTTSAGSTSDGATSTQGNSWVWRLDAWSKVVAAWRRDPIAGLGFGSGQVGGVLGAYIPHNEYLRVLVENGIIGVLLITIVAGAYIVTMVRARRAGASRLNGAMAGALTIGTAVNAAADNTLMVTPTVFFVVIFLCTALRQSVREMRVAQQQPTAPQQPAVGPAPVGAEPVPAVPTPPTSAESSSNRSPAFVRAE